MAKLYATSLLFVAGVAVAQSSFSSCTADPAVGAALDKALAASFDPQLPFNARVAPFHELLERFPEDPFVHRAWLSRLGGYNLRPVYDVEVPRYIALYGARPENPASRFLFALATQYRDPAKSKAMFEDLAKQLPDAPWPHLALVYLYENVKPQDDARAMDHLREVARICPDSLDRGVLHTIAANGEAELKKKTVERLAKQLAGRADNAALDTWPVLWELEFQVTPAAGHEQLRARIRQEVAAIGQINTGAVDRKLDCMLRGYKLATDVEGAHRVAAELLRAAPRTAAAAEATIELWEELNPYPDRSAPWSEHGAYQEKFWNAAKDWTERWPNYGPAWNAALGMVRSDRPNREVIGPLGRRLSEFLERNPDCTLGFTDQPTIEAAESLAAAGVDLDLVPGLIARGAKQAEERAKSDRGAAIRPMGAVDIERNFKTEAWTELKTRALLAARQGKVDDAHAALDTLLKEATAAQTDTVLAWRGYAAAVDAALLAPDAGIARDAIVRMSSVLAAEGNTTTAEQRLHALHEAKYWESRGRLASLEERGADAVAFFVHATNAVPRNFSPAERSRLGALAEDAWRHLGGTAEGWIAYNPDAIAGKPDEQWKEVGSKMPAFNLTDTAGRPVRTTDLAGKAVFINVWATWCGPCQGELPWVQKLYDAMKEKGDVSVLTFNVDENPGVIAEYMREHGFTFPVVLAHDYVDTVMKVEAIPRNWVVDAHGTLRFERSAGFDDTFIKDSMEALARAH